MKKISVKEPKYKKVKDGTVNVEAFRASDGRIFKGFYAEKECSDYEEKLLFKPIMDNVWTRYTPTDIMENSIPIQWYHITNDDEMKATENHLGIDKDYYDKYYYPTTKYGIGDWIGVTIEDGGDHRDTMNIFTWNFVKEDIERYMNNFNLDG